MNPIIIKTIQLSQEFIQHLNVNRESKLSKEQFVKFVIWEF